MLILITYCQLIMTINVFWSKIEAKHKFSRSGGIFWSMFFGIFMCSRVLLAVDAGGVHFTTSYVSDIPGSSHWRSLIVPLYIGNTNVYMGQFCWFVPIRQPQGLKYMTLILLINYNVYIHMSIHIGRNFCMHKNLFFVV